MITHFTIHIPLFVQKCPKNQTEASCVLRSSFKEPGSFYKQFGNNLASEPGSLEKRNWEEIFNAISKMEEICSKCKKENTER